MEKNSLRSQIASMLHELGVPTHIKGYAYLQETLALVANDPNAIDTAYDKVAEICNTIPVRVERAIRHVIEICCYRTSSEYFKQVFGEDIDRPTKTPTVRHFIFTLAEKLTPCAG